jgi:hypothetical protein
MAGEVFPSRLALSMLSKAATCMEIKVCRPALSGRTIAARFAAAFISRRVAVGLGDPKVSPSRFTALAGANREPLSFYVRAQKG